VWYSNVTLTPGKTYSFCAAVTLLKNLGNGARYILGVYANGKEIGTGRVTFDWTQICGTFTVPANGKVELSIRDPKKGLFFVAIDDICLKEVVPIVGPGAFASDEAVAQAETSDPIQIKQEEKNKVAKDEPARVVKETSSLSVTVSPNPSKSDFVLNLEYNRFLPVTVRILDISGRQIQVLSVKANQMIRFGGEFKRGTYLVEVVQGDQRKLVKVMKMN
jgi:hypothetical protein